MTSEFDKFESFLSKVDEGLIIQNEVAAEDGMNIIKALYGPFCQEEIDFYKTRLKDGLTQCTINAFQRDLIFNLFFKYFGDPQTMNAINLDDYVILVIAAKRILEASGMVLLPYIISSKITRLATRKTINKKESMKLEASPAYKIIEEKFHSEKVKNHVLGLLATILSSDFEIIDPDDRELDGLKINVIPEIIGQELLIYIHLI